MHRRKNSFHLQNFSHQANTFYAAALLQCNSRTIKIPKANSCPVFSQQSFDPSKADIPEILWSPAELGFVIALMWKLHRCYQPGMMVWKSCERNAITCTPMTCNDRKGINSELQPPPLPSLAQTTCRHCCFLELLLLHCGFAHLLQSFHSTAFSPALRSNTCSRLCVGEGKIPSLISFFLCFSNLSPEGSLNLSSGSVPSLLLSSYPASKVRVSSPPAPLSCTKPNSDSAVGSKCCVWIFPPFNHRGNCHNVCLVPLACFSTTNCTFWCLLFRPNPTGVWRLGQSWWLRRKLSHEDPK